MIREIRYFTPYPDIIKPAACKDTLYSKRELMHGVDVFLFKNHSDNINPDTYLLCDSDVKVLLVPLFPVFKYGVFSL